MKFLKLLLLWTFEFAFLYGIYFVTARNANVHSLWFSILVSFGLVAYFINLYRDLADYFHETAYSNYLEKKFSFRSS